MIHRRGPRLVVCATRIGEELRLLGIDVFNFVRFNMPINAAGVPPFPFRADLLTTAGLSACN